MFLWLWDGTEENLFKVLFIQNNSLSKSLKIYRTYFIDKHDGFQVFIFKTCVIRYIIPSIIYLFVYP